MAQTRSPQFDLRDAAGHRLSIVSSRSGKTVSVNMSGIPGPWSVAQVGFAKEQIDELARFLREDPSVAPFEVRDPEIKRGRLLAVWNGQGNRLALTLEPSSPTPWEGDLPMIDLTADQVGALEDFLSTYLRVRSD